MIRPCLLNPNETHGRTRPWRESSDQGRKPWRSIQPHRAATGAMVLRAWRNQHRADRRGHGNFRRREQRHQRQSPAAMMDLAGRWVIGFFMIGIVMVEMRDKQSTMGLGQGVDDRHVMVERKRKRRQQHGKRIGRKYRHRPGPVISPQRQHRESRFAFVGKSPAMIGPKGGLGKVALEFGRDALCGHMTFRGLI